MKKRVLLANHDRAGTMLVPLTCGLFAIIDEEDAALIASRNWHASIRPTVIYAMTNSLRGDKSTTPFTLHSFLWKAWGRPIVPEIDHENRDGLDCTRQNIRAATRAQNVWNTASRSTNTTGFKGVSRSRGGNFRARLIEGRREVWSGMFSTAEQAAIAVRDSAIEMRGRFAYRGLR